MKEIDFGLDCYLYGEKVYENVVPFLTKEPYHAYMGFTKEVPHALAFIETNCPWEEIRNHPKLLTQVFGNVKAKQKAFYKRMDNNESFLKEATCPSFSLGTILKDKKGNFHYTLETSKHLLCDLTKEFLEEKRKYLLKDQTPMDCWIDISDLSFHGPTVENLSFSFVPSTSVKKGDTYYYIGSLEIGDGKVACLNNKVLELIYPFYYENVIVWTKKRTIASYYLNYDKYDLCVALGLLFMLDRIKRVEEEPFLFLGGLFINQNNQVIYTNQISEEEKLWVQNHLEKPQRESYVLDLSYYRKK